MEHEYEVDYCPGGSTQNAFRVASVNKVFCCMLVLEVNLKFNYFSGY